MRKNLFFLGCVSSVLAILIVPLFSNADDGLIGHWKFDGNGTNEVVGSPAAVLRGNAVFRSTGGKLNGYAYIPAQGDAVKIPYASMFDLPNSFTIEFWFRQRADQSFAQDLVYKGSPINNYNFRVFRQLWNAANYGPIITGYTSSRTGYWTQTSNQNQLTHNEWHHAAFTKDTTQTAYYLDGILIHSSSQTDPAVTPANDIMVGNSAADTDIDNLRIYNRALNLAQVLQNSGLPGRQQVCTPSARQCRGIFLQECMPDGFSWFDLRDCVSGCDSETAACKSVPLSAPSATSTPETASSTPLIATPLAPSIPYPSPSPSPSVVPSISPSLPPSEATSTPLVVQPSSTSTPSIGIPISESAPTSTSSIFPTVPDKGSESATSTQSLTTESAARELKKIQQEAANFAKYLVGLSRDSDRFEKSGIAPSESFKQAIASARDFAQHVKQAVELPSIEDARTVLGKLRNSLNEYIPTLERKSRIPSIMRIVKRQIAEAVRLRKNAANNAKRRGIDVADILKDMDAHVAGMNDALENLQKDSVGEDSESFVTENFSDRLEEVRGLSDQVRSVFNIKQFIKKTTQEVTKYSRRIAKLPKSSEDRKEAGALITEIQNNLKELRPLASKRLTEENVDHILSLVASLSDALDQLKEVLDITSSDALSRQLENLFASPKNSIKRFE